MSKKEFKLFVRWLIFNEKEEVLLVEHKKSNKITSWETLLVWWKIDFWETPEQALKREIFEEIWLEVIETKLFDTQTLIIWETHWLWLYYICKTKNLNFENKEPEKHLRVFWGWVENLKDNWKKVLEKYFNNKK